VTTGAGSRSSSAFVHEALLYAGVDEFLGGTLPFIREGVEAGEPVLVVVGREKLDRLRAGLDGAASQVLFADMAEVGANPARIIPAWKRFVTDHGGAGRPLRGIGEPIWQGRTDAELVECQRHESLLNLAFSGAPAWALICPYDTESLDEAVIDEARRSHPYVVEDGVRRESGRYRGLAAIAAPFDRPLPEPPRTAEQVAFDAGSLAAARRLVARRAAAAGLAAGRVDDLVLAVNEIATNSILHGGGDGVVRVWEDDVAVVCEVDGAGRIEDPLAGREPPATGSETGRGLWIANQICELVQLRTFPTGSAVRLHMRLC
jgi:anti-sigma regulatory factor (Ser/Thr protein kinase)